MKYWNEYCPKCGNVISRRSSLNNGGGYGSPLERCPLCGYQYLNSKKIELGLVEKKYYPKLIVGGIISNFIYIALILFAIWVIGFAIMEWCLNIPFPNDIVVKILVSIWIIINAILMLRTGANFRKELYESKNRLENKEYEHLLRRSGYTPDI